MSNTIQYLDHGYVTLLNLAGPDPRREDSWRSINNEIDGSEKVPVLETGGFFCANDVDPARVARTSYDQGLDAERPESEDLKLASYLLSHRHTTPFEMIECWFEMKEVSVVQDLNL